MSAIHLRGHVFYIGVQDPAQRTFQIIRQTPYGTSYNAFLVTGACNVLVGAVPDRHFAAYLENIQSVIALEKLDYLILNHVSPDQAGCVRRLMRLCPDLRVIATATARRLAEGLLNEQLNWITVRDGDRMELENQDIMFIMAPMLPWADTMFTWFSREKTLFTGRFLGCHFAAPMPLDTALQYKSVYREEVARYFADAFGSFRSYVLGGLDRMPLDAELVCPAHGPCLTETIASMKEQYKMWAARPLKTHRTAAVLYCSAYGATELLANTMADALRGRGLAVTLTDVTKVPDGVPESLINSADLVLLGAPTIRQDAPRPVWEVLASVDALNTKVRAAAAFGSYGWSGEAPGMMHRRLRELGFRTPEMPFRAVLMPTKLDLAGAEAYAVEAASLLR